MSNLPIRRITLFKHGVAYFERHGAYEGEQLRLSFPREAMDDVLKSLVAIDRGAGQVLSVDFETPEDRAAKVARGSIHLSDTRSLRDLLRDLRGRAIRCVIDMGKKDEQHIEGLAVGVDYEPDQPLRRAALSLYDPQAQQVRTLALDAIDRVDLLEADAAADLSYFLRASQSEEDRRSAVVHLSPGEHDLLIGYVAPAPAWRVSYRLIFEQVEAPAESPSSSAFCLLQGWGLFDNQLDEDLEQVALSLMAGMPVSFRSRLYEPHTPDRPFFQDEERTISAPLMYETAAAAPEPQFFAADMLGGAMPAAPPAAMPKRALRAMSAAEMEQTVQSSAAGEERGALFAYHVEHPISVGRGQSAMVPIVGTRLPGRHELLYREDRHKLHPAAILRLQNSSGLTLERGPATVLENGSYAGEAVLPLTGAGSELLVAYAIELGVTVRPQRQNSRRLHGVRIDGEYARFEEYDLRTCTYRISSNVDRPLTVTIEHARAGGYELADTSEPFETGSDFARWQLACAPRAHVTFTVTERRLVQRREQIRSLNGEQLSRLLRDGMIDPEAAKGLDAILKLYRTIEETQRQITEAEREREALFAQQRQIQGNLQPLGREGGEGELRRRYVTALGETEDRLNTIGNTISQLRAEIERIEKQAVQRLKRVSRI